MLIRTREFIKEGRLTTILITDQCKGQLSLYDLGLVMFLMIGLGIFLFAITGMLCFLMGLLPGLIFQALAGSNIFDDDLLCIIQSQGELISANP